MLRIWLSNYGIEDVLKSYKKFRFLLGFIKFIWAIINQLDASGRKHLLKRYLVGNLTKKIL